LSGKLTVAMNEGGDPNTDIDCFGELLSPLSKKDKQYLKRTGYIRMQRGREYQAQCNRRPVSLTNDQGVGYQAFPEVILTLTTLDSSWSYTFPEEPMGPYPTERDTILKYFTDGDFVPVGAVVAFAGSYDSVPEGWELCDGEELLRNNYSELFDIIGTQYGAPSDELYFRLPDYRGVFLRASDQTDRGNAGRDSSFEERGTGHDGWEDRVGSYSTDELESHDHYVSLRLPHILRENHSGHYLQDVSLGGSGAAGYFDPEKHEVARAEKGGSSEETYPKNTLIHYIIKVANFME